MGVQRVRIEKGKSLKNEMQISLSLFERKGVEKSPFRLLQWNFLF